MYIGKFPIELKDSPFKDYSPTDFAMYFIERYGGIDGAHHKAWVLDQVARALKNCPPIITVRKWDNHEDEYDMDLGDSQEYNEWVIYMRGEYDPETEEYEYDYDIGIPP